MNERVPTIIRFYSSKFSDIKAYFSPDIPPKMITNAIKSYAPGITEGDVLYLQDLSLFGSGKDGVILTGDTLFCRNPLEKPNTIAITDIQNVIIKPAKSANTGLLLVQVEGPQVQMVVVVKDHDAQLFTQMLLEVKKALLSTEPGSPEVDLAVNVTPSVPRSEYIRLVPIEAGRLRRYSFIHLPLHGKEYGTVDNQRAGLFSNPKVILEIEMKNNRVTARTEGNDVFVNDQLLVGKQYLTDQDRISLGKGMHRADYQFQADPKLAKELRHKDEQARGIARETGGEQSDTYSHEKFVIDRDEIRLREGQDLTKIPWESLSAIVFTPDYDFLYKTTNNLGNAAGQGVVLGAQQATSTLESRKLSDLKAVFPAPVYKVEFITPSGCEGKLEQVNQRGCTWIDEAIERFAPMDLVQFN